MNKVLLAGLAVFLGAVAGSTGAAPVCTTDTAQADFQAGVANNLDLTTSPGNVTLASTGGGSAALDQQNTTYTTNGEVFTNVQWTGQTFTAGTSGKLTRVDLNLFCVFCSTAPPSIVVSVRAVSGGLPTGADLALSSLTISDFSGSQVFFTSNFANPATVTAGTQYAIIVRASAAYGSGRNLGFSNSSTSASIGNDVYAGGALIFSTNSGSSWTVQSYGTSPSSDGAFKTYIGGGTAGYTSPGDLISSLKDSAPPAGTTPTWTTLSWTATVPVNTTLRFQAAASNSTSGPFNFVGPDGSAATYFTTTNASLAQFNGLRYLKYHAYLTTANSTVTPTLADATTCHSDLAPASADLSITNTDNASGSVSAGGSIIYTVKAANAGPTDVTGATVSDTFPNGLTCNWTCAGSANGTCAASGSGNIVSSLANLPNGSSVTYTATCSVPASASGTINNAASVTSSVSDPNTANNSVNDSDSIVTSADVAVSITDNVDSARVGDVVNYVIHVSNNGPSNATQVNVGDTLPSQLSNASWVCSGSGGATCAAGSGSGTKLNTSAVVPAHGVATYIYTATLTTDNSSDHFVNTATVSLPAAAGTDPTSSNNSATDSDMIVVFAADFESGTGTAMNVTGYNGGGASSVVDLGVDAGLLNHLDSAPITVASGRTANGTKLFDLQIVRLGADIAMRTLTPIDGAVFSNVSPWQVVDMKAHIVSIAGNEGSLQIGAGTRKLSVTNAGVSGNLAQLQIASDHDIPWLVAIAR